MAESSPTGASVLKFELEKVPEQEAAAQRQAPAPNPVVSSAIATGLILALTALSQRAIIALSKLFTLLTVISVFWLCLTIHDPSTYQLVQIAMYAVFVVVVNFIVHRKPPGA